MAEEGILTDNQDRRGRGRRDADAAVANLRSQLVALKSDLEHFTRSHSSALVTDSIRERIRQAEAQLARVEQCVVILPPAEPSDGVAVHASAPHYPPRPLR